MSFPKLLQELATLKTYVDSIEIPVATADRAGLVKPDNATLTVNGDGVLSATTATNTRAGLVKPDNNTLIVTSDGVLSATTATSARAGLVKPDNNTITVTSDGTVAVNAAAVVQRDSNNNIIGNITGTARWA